MTEALSTTAGDVDALVESQIVELLDRFHDGQRERKAREIVEKVVGPALTSLRAERDDALVANGRLSRLGRAIERERDEALSNGHDRIADLNDELDVAEARALKAEAENKALRQALEPFAALFSQIAEDHGDDWLPDDASAMRASLSYPVAKMPVRWGHFRKARALLAPSESQ